MWRFCKRHPILTFLILCLVAVAIFVRVRMHGPYRSYRVDMQWTSAHDPGTNEPLYVGAAMRDITPDLSQYDSWTDADGNNKFEPKKGDTYEDRNGNGDFDFVWLAGFSSKRPAKGVNDPIGTRALAMRHGERTLVLVTIDSIGMTHERFIKVRKSIDYQKHGVDHIVFSATHTHNAPDTMGIWSYHRLPLLRDEKYIESVLEKTREAVLDAVSQLAPADGFYAETHVDAVGYVRDSRKPEVYDHLLGVMRFNKRGTDETIATMVCWGNHPEAMGGSFPMISSDFAHYWREGVENGVPEPNGKPGIGGLCLYFQGPVGGLMTPLRVHVPDRDGLTIHEEDGIGKAKALGENLAIRTLELLNGPESKPFRDHRLAVAAKSIFVPISGSFKYPMMLGVIHPGWYDGKARTEVSALRIGDVEILTNPGEIYPEIVDGGVESPEGADFPGKPIESPPLRPQMKGGLNLVMGLANDEIGYILPKTQWDVKAPYTYGKDKAPYGEIVSGGPETGPVIYRESVAILKDLHQLLQDHPTGP